MHRFRTIRVGICINGAVLLSEAQNSEWKFVISICRYEKYKHTQLVCCKTTSKKHDKIYPGEFLIKDLFGKGPSKVQPYNLVRVAEQDLPSFRYIGTLDDSELSRFEKGIRIAIKGKLFSDEELLNVLDSWIPFFDLSPIR